MCIFDLQTFSPEAPIPLEIKINNNIDLAATVVEMKVHIYMAHFYLIWIELSEVMLSHSPIITHKESKLMGNKE